MDDNEEEEEEEREEAVFLCCLLVNFIGKCFNSKLFLHPTHLIILPRTSPPISVYSVVDTCSHKVLFGASLSSLSLSLSEGFFL